MINHSKEFLVVHVRKLMRPLKKTRHTGQLELPGEQKIL